MDVEFPFSGDWLVQNSPANQVPSHGTTLFASEYAIDFVPVIEGRTAPIMLTSLFQTEPATRFPGFGRQVLAPVEGTVVTVINSEPDHGAYRGFLSIGYALTQRSRLLRGWRALAGNTVLIDHEGVIVALCHLQQGSVRVSEGDRVEAHDFIARCGNSGNSTEPHLHLQAIDNSDIQLAKPVSISFKGRLPRNGEIVSV